MTSGDLAAQRRRGRRVAGWVAATLVIIVTLAALGVYWKFRSLWTSINHVAVGARVRSSRPCATACCPARPGSSK